MYSKASSLRHGRLHGALANNLNMDQSDSMLTEFEMFPSFVFDCRFRQLNRVSSSRCMMCGGSNAGVMVPWALRHKSYKVKGVGALAALGVGMLVAKQASMLKKMDAYVSNVEETFKRVD